MIGEWLDHPEGIAVGLDGDYYAGGEAGQIYRVARDGRTTQIATTGGFVLGLAMDGRGHIHACDLKRRAVLRVDTKGVVTVRSSGTKNTPMRCPNWPVFDRVGNLYVSDSGDFWSETGTGIVFRIAPDGATRVFHNGPFRFANGMAIDPGGRWLYIAESTGSRIARVPLAREDGPAEVTHELPPDSVPDGLAFTSDGRLLVTCFKPDAIYACHHGGRVECVIEDLTGQLLGRPTNLAIEPGRIVVANLGGYHLSVIEMDVQPGPIHHPELS